MGQDGETQEEIREELKEVDKQVGDDQSANPRRENFIKLWAKTRLVPPSPLQRPSLPQRQNQLLRRNRQRRRQATRP